MADIRSLGYILRAMPSHGRFRNRSDRNTFTLLCPPGTSCFACSHGHCPFSDTLLSTQDSLSIANLARRTWKYDERNLKICSATYWLCDFDIALLRCSSLIGPPNGLLIKSMFQHFKNVLLCCRCHMNFN